MAKKANMEGMKYMLVGGFVRDKLLKEYHPDVYGYLKSKDMDYVVVGETPESMIQRGFACVGKEFPVFLHPSSGAEFALARRERKVTVGHTGFQCDWRGVTFEEDAYRRDLTCNAIMYDQSTGKYFDPCEGIEDIKNKKLRVINPKAFVEDPLRVLRIGQFWARFPDFSITEETFLVSQSCMKVEGLEGISSERIWNEVHKALSAKKPSHFFIWMFEVRALEQILPELVALRGQTQSPKYHPEGDVWIHTMQVVDFATRYGPRVAFAALVHDLGKGLTPKELLPKHHGHEQAGVPLVTAVCERLKVPKDYQLLAELVCEYHLKGHKIEEMLTSSKPGKVVKLMSTLSGGLKPNRPKEIERARECFMAFEADALGRKENPRDVFPPYPQYWLQNEILTFLLSIQMKDVVVPEGKVKWKVMHDKLHGLRVKGLKSFREQDYSMDEEFEGPYPHGEGDREHLDEMTPESSAFEDPPPF